MNLTELLTHMARYVGRIGDVNIVQMCGLAEGTNANTLKTQTAVVYNLYNTQYTKVVTDNIAMTACAAQAVGKTCYYLVSVNVAGTVTVTKGTDDALALPLTPLGNIAIGAFKVVTDGVTTFTSGTTDLSAAGITVTFYDIDCGIATTLVNQAMQRMEQTYNFRAMKVKTSFACVAGTATYANPLTNYKEIINAYAVSPTGGINFPIEKTDQPYIESSPEASVQTATQGPPKYIAEVPVLEASLTPDISPTLNLNLFPIPDVAYTVYLTAYQYSPMLDGVIYSTNWWTRNQWRTLMFEALTEAAPYVKDDERIKTWAAMSNLKLLVNSERYEEYAGSCQYPRLLNAW